MRFFRRTLLAALLITVPAFAQTPEQEANARFQAGLRYYDAREFEPARLAFTQAYSVLPKPGILINLALSELYSGHELESITHLEQYLADPSAPADKRDRAQRTLDEAMKKTSHLSLKSTPGSEVKVDNKLVSLSTVHVMPGAHTLEARAGDKSKKESVTLAAGEKKEVDLSFDAPAVVTPPPGGSGTKIETPPPPIEHDDGSYFGIRSVVGGVLIVGGSVMLGVGFASKASASDSKDKVASLGVGLPATACTGTTPAMQCAEITQAADDYKSSKSRANTLISLGIAGLGVGVVVFASSFIWKHKSFIGSTLVPQVGPGTARLDFTTNF